MSSEYNSRDPALLITGSGKRARKRIHDAPCPKETARGEGEEEIDIKGLHIGVNQVNDMYLVSFSLKSVMWAVGISDSAQLVDLYDLEAEWGSRIRDRSKGFNCTLLSTVLCFITKRMYFNSDI